MKNPQYRAQHSSDNSCSSESMSFDQDLQAASDLSLRENNPVPVIKGSEKTRSGSSYYSPSTLAEVAADTLANTRQESSV